LRLCDALEDDDDVQNVYSNLEIPDEMLAKLPAWNWIKKRRLRWPARAR